MTKARREVLTFMLTELDEAKGHIDNAVDAIKAELEGKPVETHTWQDGVNEALSILEGMSAS